VSSRSGVSPPPTSEIDFNHLKNTLNRKPSSSSVSARRASSFELQLTSLSPSTDTPYRSDWGEKLQVTLPHHISQSLIFSRISHFITSYLPIPADEYATVQRIKGASTNTRRECHSSSAPTLAAPRLGEVAEILVYVYKRTIVLPSDSQLSSASTGPSMHTCRCAQQQPRHPNEFQHGISR
jgi:hypothetical protein